eukprot:TRINITY_DN46953_c0_g1_i1.p1 TRINITY_DN46953_c0_g1~~TRINITY_DN46953_c0_g1_i1.p1  ORF type:complete len:584 (+),score=110.93 TRINITY_DN46953_c0_g1_i1:48-1754(+)
MVHFPASLDELRDAVDVKFLAFLVVGGLSVRWYMKKLPKIPEPSVGIPILGHIHHLMKHMYECPRLVHRWLSELPPPRKTLQVQLLSQPHIFTRDPAVIRQFMTDQTHFDKGHITLRALKPFLGDGIFAVNGDQWLAQRAAAQPLFHKASLEAWVPVMVSQAVVQHAREFAAASGPEAGSRGSSTVEGIVIGGTKGPRGGAVVDIQGVARRYTLGTFLEMGIGLALPFPDMVRFGTAFDYLNQVTTERYLLPFGYTLAWSWNKNLQTCYRLIDDAITAKTASGVAVGGGALQTKHDLAAAGKATSDPAAPAADDADADEGEYVRPDVMSRFMSLSAPERRQELRDIIMNFIIAGRDTTAALIAHTLWLLAIHPQCQQRLVAELAEHGLLDPSVPLSYASLFRAEYLKSCVKEALRLFPSVPLDGYNAKNGATLAVDGQTVSIPDGTPVFYDSYSLHRLAEYFGPNPDAFDPDRWQTIRPPSYAFIPFHSGPRTCMGRELAYLETKTYLVLLLRSYDILPTPKTPKRIEDLKMFHAIISGAAGGIEVEVVPVDRSTARKSRSAAALSST